MRIPSPGARAVVIGAVFTMSKHALAVTAPFVFLCLCPSAARAQSDSDHVYVAQLVGVVSEHDEKLVNEAMNDWEALERFEVSLAAHRLKFNTAQPVDEAQLNERLAGAGVRALWLAQLQADGSLSGASYEAHMFPLFVDTGDPAGDNARYDADKAAWLAAHPGWVDRNTRIEPHHDTEEEIDK